MQLTEHFNLEEFTDSDTAVRVGIDNTPPASVIDNIKRTASLAETVRAALCEIAGKDIPIIITSGYRCERLEKLLCMADYEGWCLRHDMSITDQSWSEYFSHKAHPRGRAIDFRAHKFGDTFHIVRMLAKNVSIMAMTDQIIMEGVTRKSEGWVHLSWSPAPRHEIMTAIFDEHGTPHYQHGLT